jgi:branched-chain amino acid aminotransferase
VTILASRLLSGDGGSLSHLPLDDRGLLLGDGVFDTMTSANRVVPGAGRHRERLIAAAAAIGITVDATLLRKTIEDVLAEIGFRPAIVRTTISRGGAARGLWPAQAPVPTILITAQPWDLSVVGQPAALTVASEPRNQHSTLSRIKALAYLENILAARDGALRGADDALILNLDGKVACATVANVFTLKDGLLTTPPLADGCLDGIVRGELLDAAGGFGLRAREASLAPVDLHAADAVFLTNSVRLLRPVTRIDGRAIAQSAGADVLLAHLRSQFEPKTSSK